MKSKLAIAISLSGWVLLAAYIIYDYVVYDGQITAHFFQPPHHYELFFHIMVLLGPFVSTAMGYLVNKKTELLAAVKESEGKYSDLYQNAPDGYHSLGVDGTILEVNNTWLKMLGYERDKVAGRMKITDILNEEGLRTFEQNYPAFKEKGIIDNIEFDFRRKDGSLFPVIVNSTALYDVNGKFSGSRSTVRDNTIGKGYQQILERASAEWRVTFDSMPYGVMLLDSEFNIIRTNEYISGFSGMPLKELISKKCYDVIHANGKPPAGCPLEKSIKSRNTEALEYFDADLGKYFIANITPIFDKDGIAIAYVHSLIDITDMKGKEKRLMDSRDAFLNMLKDATSTYNELKSLYHNLILAFANAIDAKSTWTRGHSERVSEYALSIGKELNLNERDMEDLRVACLLHDIGKIGTYDGILDKPGKLTDEEFALVKKHPLKGEEILMPIKELEHILCIIRSHHERVDGKGYVDGLRGEEIPFLARILCVADSFDSMTADRPYRPSPGKEYAVSELKKCSGTQFDPIVVGAFLKVLT